MARNKDLTPYSTTEGFLGTLGTWAPTEEDNTRIAAYKLYDEIYWNVDQALELIRRNDDGRAVYLPKPMIVVNTTAHYLLKGLEIQTQDPQVNTELETFLLNFILRERFFSKFHTAKHAGIRHGDWVLHLTADPLKDEGTRISVNSVDPGMYFPEYDNDDLEKRTGAKLVEQWPHPEDPQKTVVKVLRYWQEYDPTTGKRVSPLVWREENLWEMEGWDDLEKKVKVQTLIPPATLPSDITSIPLYHFKNQEDDGQIWGNSELKGFERLFQAVDQAISDEEISLALTGLGVYATDAGRPRDAQGKETDWVVAPGAVWELPGATMVKRLEGITSVTPVLDHVRYLEENIYEGTSTSDVALGRVDVQTAESGIALALRFMPTLAKIESRDTSAVELLTQFWYDWKFWVKAYEKNDWTAIPILVRLGQKLPVNRTTVINELNNMKDRKIISAAFYREEAMRQLGYAFPKDEDKRILQEQRDQLMLMQEFQEPAEGEEEEEKPGPGGRLQGEGDTQENQDRNRSNNRERPNESRGTEA